jgi:hypothetical protein
MRKSARLADPGAEFLDSVTGLWSRFGRILLIALGVIAAVVLGTVLVANNRAAAEQQASAKLMEADMLFWQGDYPRALQSARQTYEQWGQTRSGTDAHRIAGDAQFWQGDFKSAVTEYRAYLEHVKVSPLAESVRRSLAYALESQGNPRTGAVQPTALEEAQRTYLSLVGVFDRESSAEFLIAAARCARALHHDAQAVQFLQRVDREFGETAQANRARMELAELEASGAPVTH